MKKLLVSLLLATILVFGGIALGEAIVESVKTLQLQDLKVTVPELAPDFLRFKVLQVISEKLPSGVLVKAVILVSEDQNVKVMALMVDVLSVKKVSVLVLQVKYEATQIIDTYADVEFLKTGKPSDKLVKVQELPDIDEILAKLNAREI